MLARIWKIENMYPLLVRVQTGKAIIEISMEIHLEGESQST